MKSVLTRHPSDIYLLLRVPFESWWNKQASPVFKQHLSRGQAADEHSEWRWCCLTPAHTREQTHAHTHTGQRHAPLSFFPGCTLRGGCSPHNSVLSCQNASLLAAAYPVSLIGADRDCSPKTEPRVYFIYFCTRTHAEFNEIHCGSVEAPCESQGLLLKWTSATLKRCMARGESCACLYGLHQRWAPSEPVRMSHSDRVFCLGVILKLFSTPR